MPCKGASFFLSQEKGMKGEKSKEQRVQSTEKKRARRARRKTLYAFDTFYAFTPYSKAVFEQRVADAYDEPIFRHTKGEVRSILNVCEELRLAV